MPFEQLVVAVNPGYEPVRCKVCDYRWAKLADVPANELHTCPWIFYDQHHGGHTSTPTERATAPIPAPLPAEEYRDAVRSTARPVEGPSEATGFFECFGSDLPDVADDDEEVVEEKYEDVLVTAVELFTPEELANYFNEAEHGDAVHSVSVDGIPAKQIPLLVTREVRKYYCIVCEKPTGGDAKVCPEHAGILRVIKRKAKS